MNKLTLIMFALCLSVGGFAYYEYQEAQREESQQKKEAMLLGWEDVEFKSVEHQGYTTTLRVEKKDGAWSVTSPVQDLGDEFSIKAWASDIATEKATEIKAKKDEAGEILWSEYGLDEEQQVLLLETQDGRKARIEVAKNNGFDGAFYLRYKDRVYLGPKTWASVFGKTAKALRNQNLIRMQEKPIAQFRLKRSGKIFSELAKTANGEWASKTNKTFPIDGERVQSYLQTLYGIKVKAFIDSEKDSILFQKLAKSFKNSADFIVELILQDSAESPQEKRVISFQKVDERWFGKSNAMKFFVELNAGPVEQLRVRKSHFRDRQIPFQFDMSEIKKVEIKIRNQRVAVEKNDNQWQISPEQKRLLDGQAFEDFLVSMKTLKVEEYLDTVPKGANLDHRVRMFDEKGETAYELSWGFHGENPDSIFAQSTAYRGGFKFLDSSWKELKLEKFFKTANNKNSNSQPSVTETSLESRSLKSQNSEVTD